MNYDISEVSNLGNVPYDPDSSPEAWEHYKKIYCKNELQQVYDILNPTFYESLGKRKGKCFNGEWYNYSDKLNFVEKNYYHNKPGVRNEYARLFALDKNVISKQVNGVTYFQAIERLSGDCNFNFNEKKCFEFKKIFNIENATEENLKQLEYCKTHHHKLINFSLMQSMGDMQKAKSYGYGDKLDRFDSFISLLNDYYENKSDDAKILKYSTNANKVSLINFLDKFENVYKYCEVFYFIDKSLVDELIENGKKQINNSDDIIRYIELAKKYWKYRNEVFKKIYNA